METQETQQKLEGIGGPSSDVDEVAKASRTIVTPLRKEPPQESSKSIRVRGLVILSFWAVVVFLGLPTWWWTTSIHRARLPLQEMLDWADGKVTRHPQRQGNSIF